MVWEYKWNSLILNDMWEGIYEEETIEREDGLTLIATSPSTTSKEITIWNNKDKKAYVLIVATISQ